MAERLIFITGHLARPRLEKLLIGLGKTDFQWEIVDIGVKVAALMTGDIIKRRLKNATSGDRIILPGRYRGSVEDLSAHFNVPFIRGPDEIADLPAFLGREGNPPDLSGHDMRIFAEIVDSPMLSLDALVSAAEALRPAGPDVIELGCLPPTPFPLLEEAVRVLKAKGFSVSVDSADLNELEAGARAGADFVLSLTEETLWLALERPVTPVLIPSAPGDIDSLGRAI